MNTIGAQRSKADVCLFFQWTSTGLLIYISWVDDILIAGTRTAVAQAKTALKKHFTLDEQGELQEYVGCKIERDKQARWIKITQPVMIQSFSDEFDLPIETAVIPAKHGEVLSKDDGVPLNKGLVKTYRSGIGKMLHMMKWSRNDILIRVRELSRFLSDPRDIHLNRMHKVMTYVRSTASLGNFIKPDSTWRNTDKSFTFVITCRSDSEYASEPETRRSVSGGTEYLCGAVIFAFSRMQRCVNCT
jgi:hypothetical protein